MAIAGLALPWCVLVLHMGISRSDFTNFVSRQHFSLPPSAPLKELHVSTVSGAAHREGFELYWSILDGIAQMI